MIPGHGPFDATRYESPALGPKPFRTLIMRLDELGFLSLRQSARRGEVSSINPTQWFIGKMSEHGVSLADFARDATEEVIRDEFILADTAQNLRKLAKLIPAPAPILAT